MQMSIETRVAGELSLNNRQVLAVVALLDEGATVPFIARYRKERTGSLDEVAIATIRDRRAQLHKLEKRRQVILSSLAERDLLTDDLQFAIVGAETMPKLEDLYLPYRPKRRTRATIAREMGLEPLADELMRQDPATDPGSLAEGFVDPERGVDDAEGALAGARDIIAEKVNESAEARNEVRAVFESGGTLHTTVVPGQEDAGSKFRDYFDWTEPLSRAPGHRVHAALRAEREGAVRLSVLPAEEQALEKLRRRFVVGSSEASEQVRLAVTDGYRRLMAPSMENECRSRLKERADDEAVKVFAANLEHLLMAPPLGQKRVMAVDPGLRTGCKVVCLDAQGRLLTYQVAQIAASDRERVEAAKAMVDLVEAYAVEAIAIGNGTASRETEAFVRGLDLGREIPVVIVNESGASVYSASDIARHEMPDQDVTVRGAVSIGRRLMDPLAELVKIDPKSIGVGQYQHDVDQSSLHQTLDDVVERCVNAVGVEVNTASAPLLARVSGLGPALADNIVAYRDDNGPFDSRRKLLDVPRLGPKAYEQAAGFLRVTGGKEPLDASAVHPERYALVRRMARDLGCKVTDLQRDETLRGSIKTDKYVAGDVGLPTLSDILTELAKPGRDPRQRFVPFSFSADVTELQDLSRGMTLPGVVTNVTNFGAFVDVGVHQDGLVHISQMADRYVRHPSDVVHVGQRVSVTVLDVDVDRRRIGLSLRGNSG